MINWEFDPNNVEDRSFEPLPVGDYRVRIEDVEEGERIIQLSSTKDTYAKDQVNKRKWCKTEEVLLND